MSRPIASLMLLLAMKLTVGIPLAVEPERAEIKDRLRACFGPAHAGLFHAILDEVAAGPFHDARAHRPATREIRVIVHVGRVAAVVAGRAQQLSWLLTASRAVLWSG